MVNDKFIDYFEVFFHSLKKHNTWLKCPLIVIWSKNLSPLSEESRKRIETIWPDVRYHEVDEDQYRVFLVQTPEHMLPALFTLECFSLHDWDKVVFFDVDMLCLGDVSELFKTEVPFGVCPSGGGRTRKQRLAGGYHLRFGLNSGVLVLGRKFRSQEVYNSFFSHKGGDKADQDVLEHYFRWKPVYCFDHKYNYQSQFFWDEYGAVDDVRILHYAGEKPLAHPQEARMKPWINYRNGQIKKDEVK
ncbi:MAG: glycosyltransferase [Kiritimatiellae bacterium]|nr:glycosyltransferase [Kiritimatiellia bacterium]